MKLYSEIEKTFPTIKKALSQEDLLIFKNTPKDDLYLYHFGLGLWIRNNLLFNSESNLYDLFFESGVRCADDMSDIIIRMFYCHVKNINF